MKPVSKQIVKYNSAFATSFIPNKIVAEEDLHVPFLPDAKAFHTSLQHNF